METADSLAHVAERLNRVSRERALFWLLGSAAFALAVAAGGASRLSPLAFRVALAGLVAAVLAIGLACALRLRAQRADAIAAARWVEARVALEERLLTLASASSEGRSSRLWPDLEDDNRSHASRWSSAPLGIPRVPANAGFLVAGLAAALLSLLPNADRPSPPPEVATAEESALGGDTEGAKSPAAGGGGLAHGLPAGSAEGATAGDPAAQVAAAVEAVRTDLAQRFDRSIAASVIGRSGGGSPPGGPSDGSQLATRGKPERGGISSTKGEAGGRPPDESLSRLEQDDGSGQPVRAPEPEGGTGAGRPTQSGSNPQGSGQEGGKGDARGGGAGKAQASGRGNPDAAKVAADLAGNPNGSAGGAGAGAGKATAALLAQKPLTLAGDRQTARFSLTIGAGTRDGKPSEDEGVPTQPKSRIADVTRGTQAADRSVRHEEIPPEYESVVKRIFAREP